MKIDGKLREHPYLPKQVLGGLNTHPSRLTSQLLAQIASNINK